MIKKDWIKKVKSVHPKSDEQVLQFIYDFRTMQKSEAAEEAIYTQFEKISRRILVTSVVS